MKATDTLSQLIEEINDTGLSDYDGVYGSVTFSLQHEDINIVPSRPVKMNIHDALKVSNQLASKRFYTSECSPPVTSLVFHAFGGRLDAHVTCDSANLIGDVGEVVAQTKVLLQKYAVDNGFTPGTHYYNVVDAWIPWESARTVDFDRSEEGWI